MVNEGGVGVLIIINGYIFVDIICVVGNNVVEFVGYVIGFGNVVDGIFVVEFGSNNVVYYIISVINFEVVGFDVIDGGRVDNGDVFFFGNVGDFMSMLEEVKLLVF